MAQFSLYHQQTFRPLTGKNSLGHLSKTQLHESLMEYTDQFMTDLLHLELE